MKLFKKVLTFAGAVALTGFLTSAVPVSQSTPVVPEIHNASPVETPNLNAKEILLPIGNTGKTISLLDLSTISLKEFQSLSGKKLSIFDKIGFKLGQRKLRSNLDDNGNINSKAIKKYAGSLASDGDSGFHIGGFALGFFLQLVGVLIAYLINDDKKSSRVKWAWLGLATVVVISLLAFAL